MISAKIRYGDRKLPVIPSEEHFEKVRLATLLDNKEFLETARQVAYKSKLNEEVPKLTTANTVLAFEYFNNGWDAAIAELSKVKG